MNSNSQPSSIKDEIDKKKFEKKIMKKIQKHKEKKQNIMD